MYSHKHDKTRLLGYLVGKIYYCLKCVPDFLKGDVNSQVYPGHSKDGKTCEVCQKSIFNNC